MNNLHKQNIGEQFWKKKDTYNQEAVVQKHLCDDFFSSLLSLSFAPTRVLEIGCGTGFMTKKLAKISTIDDLYVNDISEQMKSEIDKIISSSSIPNYTFLAGDAESIPFPAGIDTIVSTSAMQWFSNLHAFFKKVSSALPSQGIFAFSTFGTHNFMEIKRCLHISLHYTAYQEMLESLSHDFEIIKSKEWQEKLWFDSPKHVLRHIQNTGVGGLAQSYIGKQQLAEFAELYTRLFTTDNKAQLTYNPIIVIAKKK